MFVLGALVTPGAKLRWYDIVFAPLCMPFLIGKFIAIVVVKNNRALPGPQAEKESSKKVE